MSLSQTLNNPLPQRKPKRAVKGQDVASNPPSDGIYSNKLMVHSVMLLAGHQVDVELIDSSVWTGILRTVSPEMAIVLSVAHLKKNTNTKNKQCLLASHDAVRPHLVIPFGEVVTISAAQIDTPLTDNFMTDIEIGALNGTSDRDLKPFTDFDEDTGDFSTITETGGGWSVEDMISTNESRFNVKSTYTDDLQGYTTQLEQSDEPEYLLRQRRANQLAQEIVVRDRIYNEGDDVTNTTSEEGKYSSVVRPTNTVAAMSPSPQSSSPTYQKQQDSGFVEHLGDVSGEPPVVASTQSAAEPNKNDQQEEPDVVMESPHDDVLEDLKDFGLNFNLQLSNDSSNPGAMESSQMQANVVAATTGTEDVLKTFKLNPLAEEFNPVAVSKVPSSPTTSYNAGRRNSRGRGYNQQYYQQPHSMLSTLPDYMAQQSYMASSYPSSQVMPMYQALSQQQQQGVTSPRQQARYLLSPQVFSGTPYYDGMNQMIAMPHTQQTAALISQLPSNRQTMVTPTQPVYIIPQPQGTSGMPPTPSLAFQPAQFAALGSPQLSAQFMPSTYQM